MSYDSQITGVCFYPVTNYLGTDLLFLKGRKKGDGGRVVVENSLLLHYGFVFLYFSYMQYKNDSFFHNVKMLKKN